MADEAFQCNICYNGKINRRLDPCGHTFCQYCADEVGGFKLDGCIQLTLIQPQIVQMSDCPNCRQPVTDAKVIYL